MTVTSEEENSSPDLVPETLLALAKDSRYIRQCQELLTSIFRQRDDVDETYFWWWSALLYATLVVVRKKKTLGMEFVGLQHAPTSRWQERIGKLVVAAGWALWMRHCIQWERRYLQNNREEQRHERLRGAARQYYFEQQRRAMMQRASRASGGDDGQVHVANASSALANERTSSSDLTERIKLDVKRIIQITATAISSSSDNPHALPDTTALLSIGRWTMRLFLAHYCITGRYPTLGHLFLNSSVERPSKSRISEPPPTTHALVGKLILIQAGATLTQTCARWLSNFMVSRGKQETQQIRENEGDSPSNDVSSSLQQHCAICRMPRTHSAAPSSCGHVFCWKCLYQWVSTVRPECPLCRAACRPQDVVALYNYAPSS